MVFHEETATKTSPHSRAISPGSSQRASQYGNRLPLPLSIGEASKSSPPGPASAPAVHYDLDPNTVAIAQAAAAAAYNEAIKRSYYGSTSCQSPLTPTSPPRHLLQVGSSEKEQENVSAAKSGPNYSPPSRYSPTSGNSSTSPTGSDHGGFKKESKKSSLYKTELCRSWEESGTCRYGAKCQFAHSVNEIRNLERHPKYKTELCKTFWERGSCPYGKRCCFIHTEKTVASAPGGKSTGNGNYSPPTPSSARSSSVSPDSTTQQVSGGKSLLAHAQDSGAVASPTKYSTSKPRGISISTPSNDSANKLFDQVTNEFSLWSPSINSPDTQNFPFPPASQVEKKPKDGPNDYPTSPIGTSPASSILFLNTRDVANADNGFSRSTLSAGIPSTTPFFLDTSSVGVGGLFESRLNDYEVPMSAPATRFPPQSIFNQPVGSSPIRTSANPAVPVLGHPPARSFGASDTLFGINSPLSASFTSVLEEEEGDDKADQKVAQVNRSFAEISMAQQKREPTILESTRQPVGRPGTLRKFDSGVHFQGGRT